MSENNGGEYIFWLDGWADRSAFLPKNGHFKCIITDIRLTVIPLESGTDKELSIDISEIENCRIHHKIRNPNYLVGLLLHDRRIDLAPVNPFEPSLILHVNHNEATEMINVINAFRSGVKSEVNPNPYLRELATDEKYREFRRLDIKWDEHTSPWDYQALYGDKFLWLKVIAYIIFIIVILMVISLPVIYLLDTLNII